MWYPLNRTIARRATRRNFAVALVFPRHRCVRHTIAVEVVFLILAALATRWRTPCLGVALAGLAASYLRRRFPRAGGADVDRAVGDVGAAWRWLGTARLGLGLGERRVLGGYSCGAHAALLYAVRCAAPPPAEVVLLSGVYDVGDAFHGAWAAPTGSALDGVLRCRFGHFLVAEFMDDVTGARTADERRRASLPPDARALRLAETAWRVAYCGAEFGGFEPFQSAFFTGGLARLLDALRAAGARVETRALRGNHWTLPRHLDAAFEALLPS